MKTAFTILLGLTIGSILAQPNLHRTVPCASGQKVRMEFDYPNLIRISTWDKNEVSIEGTISINGGEHNDAFKLQAKTEGNTVFIGNEINLNGIPHRTTIIQDGQKIVFKDKDAFRKYQEEHGRKFDRVNDGVEMEILLEIKVPHNAETVIISTYGLVEVKNFNAPLVVKATYGGVDAALTEAKVGELKAETNYGHIYSGLETKFNSNNTREEDFHVVVNAKLGNGPGYSFESPYGNVYLRKNQ